MSYLSLSATNNSLLISVSVTKLSTVPAVPIKPVLDALKKIPIEDDLIISTLKTFTLAFHVFIYCVAGRFHSNKLLQLTKEM